LKRWLNQTVKQKRNNMGKPGPKAHSVINDLLKKAKGKSPLKAMYGQPLKKVAFSSGTTGYKKY